MNYNISVEVGNPCGSLEDFTYLEFTDDDLEHLQSGMYYYRIVTASETLNGQVVKQ